MKKFSELVINTIKNDEGLRLEMYKCPAGKWTIGYGHNLESNAITQDVADLILQHDLENCYSDLIDFFGRNWEKEFNENVQTVLMSMMFNLGYYKFSQFKKFINAVNEKDFKRASAEIINSKAYKQCTKRYQRLANLIKK